jgi:endogenous inhibitor of DNA gyrase (YacG/DUF329 family)
MLTVKCPTCKRSVEWTEGSTYRPFCSNRCRLIDLGAWFSEEHAIPGDPVTDGEDPQSLQEPQDP